jgi:AcrR family transcriptional regulator
MIAAARQLFRERGYLGTAFSDVLEASGAPRGSVYFHFPGGKEELGTEVAIAHGAETIALINRSAARAGSVAELLTLFLAQARDRLVSSGYREGCAVAPMVVELIPSAAPITETIGAGFRDSLAVLAARLAEKGVPGERAASLAATTMAGLEGALIVSRAVRSREPFDALIADVARLGAEAAGVGQ